MSLNVSRLLQQAINDHRGNRLDAAADAYRQVIAAQPNTAVAHHNLGLVAWARNDAQGAFQGFLRAAQLAPNNPDFGLSLAEAARILQWPDAAVGALRQCLAKCARPPLALFVAGAEAMAGHGVSTTQAAIELSPALRLADRSAEDWHNFAFHLNRLGCLEAALRAIDKALAPSSGGQGALRLSGVNLKAVILRGLHRGDEARALLADTVRSAPDHAPSWNNLATLLKDVGDFAAADHAVQTALTLVPNYAQALCTAGSVATAMQNYSRARELCEKALALQPDYPEAHWNLALACLAEGDYERGWAEYEWRRKLDIAKPIFPDFGIPDWRGEPLDGKTLLIYAEQGNGDTLQFVRLAAQLAQAGARVVARVQPGLVRLLQHSPFLAAVVGDRDAVPAADYCLPVMSLPHRTGVSPATVPTAPYLFPPPAAVDAWKQRLGERKQPTVGLVWAGDPRPDDPESNRIDRRRSLAFTLLAPILALPGLTFVSLQKGGAAGQLIPGDNLLDPTADLHDFAETAALITQLDAVVSADTAVAHLAAALDVPTVLLSRFDACWRWMGNRPTTPWYPSMRIVGQPAPGDWASVVEAVARSLPAMLTNAHEQ